MEAKSETGWWVSIHIAGDIEQAKQVCREYCHRVGLCVTVAPTTYIYTGGEEAGVTVRLIKYPRFPTTNLQLNDTARELAELLVARLCQHSYTLESPAVVTWMSRRDEHEATVAKKEPAA